MENPNIIYGTCPSKSNCYKIITLGNHASLAKTKVLNDYERNFYIQCRLRGKMIETYFELHVDVYYPSERADLDNSLKIVLDCLQHAKAIKNDNKCTAIIARKFKDPEKPRIEFLIKEV